LWPPERNVLTDVIHRANFYSGARQPPPPESKISLIETRLSMECSTDDAIATNSKSDSKVWNQYERQRTALAKTWSNRAGAGRAEAFLRNPRPVTACTANDWGVVAEGVPNGRALSRARELAELYLKAPELTRPNTRVDFIRPLKRIVREVGYGLVAQRCVGRRPHPINASPK